MPLSLDHAVIAVNALDAAIEDYRQLGFTVVRGGMHANRATHNALITFANGTYLELLATTGEPLLPGVIDFSTLLLHGEGLVGFALRSDDLEAEAARLRAEGFAIGPVIPGERRRADGKLVQWKLALLDDAFAPFLIQDVTPRAWRISADPALTTHPNTAQGLRRVEVATRDLPGARNRYAQLFGITPPLQTADDRALGDVMLSAALGADNLDGPSALHLDFASDLGREFALEHTHGVRIVRSTPG